MRARTKNPADGIILPAVCLSAGNSPGPMGSRCGLSGQAGPRGLRHPHVWEPFAVASTRHRLRRIGIITPQALPARALQSALEQDARLRVPVTVLLETQGCRVPRSPIAWTSPP